MDAPVLEIVDLAKRYGSFEAVGGISLALRRGEILALLGPNGAGKTTTIRMVMGILQPTAGTARVAGLDCFVDRVEVKRLVGYLPDEPVFYDYLRGYELLDFVASMHGLPPALAAERIGPLVERFEIASALGEYVANYSRGMKKKFAAVCALVHQPEVLILDEPTNGLDPLATRVMHEIILERARAGVAVFFSTHLLDAAQRICDRAAILHQGRVAAIGALGELRADLAAGGSLEEVFFAVTAAERPDAAATETAP